MLPRFRGPASWKLDRQMLAVTVLVLAGIWQRLGAMPYVESPAIHSADFHQTVEAGGPRSEASAFVDIPLDYDLGSGHFFRQSAPAISPLSGYTVSGPLWLAFQANGGLPSLGYPLSEQWVDGRGNLRQAFERGVIVVEGRDNAQTSSRVDVVDEIMAEGKGSCLETTYRASSTPALNGKSDGHSLLDGDPPLRDAYLSHFDWRERFGLPLALRVEAEAVVLTTQRAIFQRSLVDSPSSAAGAVNIFDASKVAAACGVVPEQALRPGVSPNHGWLRVSGRQIVDGKGNTMRITGINWSGFELRDFAPRGLAVRDYSAIVDRIAELGFNTIRLPFSNEMVERNPLPDPQIVAACPACQGKRALELLDLIVDYAGAKGMRVILDNHFSAASDQAGSVLWYTREYPHQTWLRHWRALAERYRDNPTVVGFDLRNEPHGPASWGSGDRATDWRLAAEEAGRELLSINPRALIIVEGIESFPKPGGGVDLIWWGGNLQGVRQFPVRLPAENLIYSPHDYGPTLYRQSWFNSETSAETLNAIWHKYWAYLNSELDLPLLIGEIGTGNTASDIANVGPGSQGQWFQALASLLRGRDNLHWIYWTVDAQDQYALFDPSYASVANPEKLAPLQPALGQGFQVLPRIRPFADITEPSAIYMRRLH